MGDVIMSIVISTLALLGIVSSLFAMWTQQTTLSYVAFAIPLITGPAVLMQRTKLQWMNSFRNELQKVRKLICDMAMERLQLQTETQRLEREYRRMADVEDRFRLVVLREGKSVDVFRAIVKENAHIQAEIRKEHAMRELQDMFSIIMSSDKNSNGRVSRGEIDKLIQRLHAFAEENGKFIDEDLIRNAFQRSILKNAGTSQCAFSMFNVVQGAMSDEAADDAIVVERVEKDIEDGFVKVHKTPRVTATGLVLAYSVEDGEGGLVHPIRAQPVYEQAKTVHAKAQTVQTVYETELVDQSIAGTQQSQSSDDETLSDTSSMEEGNAADVVLSQLLTSFSQTAEDLMSDAIWTTPGGNARKSK